MICTPEAATAAATIVIALFTVVLALTGGVQGWLTWRAVNLTRLELIQTHRPRIILREVYIDDGKIWFRLVNTGGTSATIIESYVMTEIANTKAALRSLLSTGKDDLGRRVLTGGEYKELPYKPTHDHAFIFNMGGGPGSGTLFTGPLYFTGTIVYVDDLGTRRRSVFRRQWHNGDRRFIRLPPEEERDNEYAD